MLLFFPAEICGNVEYWLVGWGEAGFVECTCARSLVVKKGKGKRENFQGDLK